MIQYFNDNSEQILQILASVIALASLIATMTPNESDNIWVNRLNRVVSWLALNVGRAKSKGK
jgi:hypothetical protein